MKGQVHPAADIVPACELLRRQAKPRHELGAAQFGEQVDHLQRPAHHPHGHHIHIGILVKARRGRIRITVVKLVGAYHATNFVSPAHVTEYCYAGPEAGDLEDELRTVRIQELKVVRDLKVLPNIVSASRPGHAPP